MSDGRKQVEHVLMRLEAHGATKNLPDAGNVVLNAAKMMCSGFIRTTGQLRGSLDMTITNNFKGQTAHVGTNKQYAMYVEFGTGQKGAANHSGTSPDITPVYTLEPWWIHESMIDPQAAAVYHWAHIDTEQGRFYKVTGQPAHPFLYPALKDNEDTVIEILEKGLKEAFKGK